MGFRINTNISAMTANLHANSSNMATQKSIESLSSGSALGSAAYDASGLTIANQLSAQVSGLGQSIMNANESIGMIQIADGALNEYGNILDDVRNLTLKAGSGIMNNSNRAIIQNQIDGLMQSADQIINTTSYNGQNLFNNSFTTHTGANAGETQTFGTGDARSSAILDTAIDVSSSASIDASLKSIDGARESISSMRSDLGSSQNQLMSTIRNTSVTQINVASAQSQIADIDFAAESANFSKANLSAQIGSFTQAQANASAANVLNLFN